MIDYKNKDNWNNIITLAPNGSGKSITSRKLYSDSDEKNTRLFSSEKIYELVTVNSKKVFVGIDSKNKKDNDIIYNKLDKSKYIKNFANEFYKKTKAIDLKKVSNYFFSIDLKNMSDLNLIFKTNVEKLDKRRTIYDAVNIDKKYPPTFIDKIKNQILNSNEDLKSLNGDYDIKNIIPTEIYDNLNSLKSYMDVKSYKKCILCGFNDNNIIDKVTVNLEKYIKEDKNNLSQSISVLYNELCTYDCSLESEVSLNDKYKQLILVYNEIEENNIYIESYLLNNTILFEDKNYYLNELVSLYRKNEKIISDNVDNKNIFDFENIIIEEFEKLVTLPPNVFLEFDKNALVVKVNNNVDDINNVLSSSEIKRLGLAVLKAEIISSKVEYVIFDDPVDSYDDYYMKIASVYIAKLLIDYKIKYTIFTHLYEFLYYVVKEICNEENRYYIRLIYQNPWYCLGDKKLLFEKSFIKYSDVLEINNNEINILNNSLNGKCDLFIVLSMYTTIRSEIDLIDKSSIIKDSHINLESIKNIDKLIQSSLLHYNENNNVKVKDFVDLCNKIIFKEKSITVDDSLLEMNINDVRYNYLNKDKNFVIKLKNIMIECILIKMLRVQYCKYLLEKKLLILCKKILNADCYNIICSIYTIGSKIAKLKELNINDAKLKNIENIHNKYRLLINETSHGFDKLYNPYLMMNVIDIAKFENDLNLLII